jgi:hypothetical protein
VALTLNVIMLSVVASFSQPKAREKGGKSETKLTDTKMNNLSLSMELHIFFTFLLIIGGAIENGLLFKMH